MFKVQMEIKKAAKRQKGKESKGWTLYGRTSESWEWFERWFPTKEKAENYANKKGWTVTYI